VEKRNCKEVLNKQRKEVIEVRSPEERGTICNIELGGRTANALIGVCHGVGSV